MTQQELKLLLSNETKGVFPAELGRKLWTQNHEGFFYWTPGNIMKVGRALESWPLQISSCILSIIPRRLYFDRLHVITFHIFFIRCSILLLNNLSSILLLARSLSTSRPVSISSFIRAVTNDYKIGNSMTPSLCDATYICIYI